MKKRFLSLIPGLGLIGLALASCGTKETPEQNSKPQTQAKTHDQQTLKVTGKETYEPHDFKDGKCSMCSESSIFTCDFIADKDILKKECSEKGSIKEISYTTRSYYTERVYPNAGELSVTKKAYVYLPYGYDENDKTVKYDVLYLLHGSGLNEGYWLAQGTYTKTDACYTMGFGTDNLLDNMMKDGLCKKTIVVTPTLYAPVENYPVDNNNEAVTTEFYKELQNDLMPYIAKNYNTYASDSTPEALKANRDHQAYAGLSLGSMTSFGSIFANSIEYFSYIGSFSGATFGHYSKGNGISAKNIVDKFKKDYSNLDLKYWFACCGTADKDHYNGLFSDFREIKEGLGLKEGSDISKGCNCEFIKVNKGGHNYATWITALYDSMQVFFKK
jgi:enterochelin esterase-like enzyme